jgi:preprotein translocase subunit SecG
MNRRSLIQKIGSGLIGFPAPFKSSVPTSEGPASKTSYILAALLLVCCVLFNILSS